ncbi:DNA-binding response regulator [Amycolatopsis sp. NPDC058340]|nr:MULTISPECIES: response regulator transcription factor [Amycolatopsis]OLZ44346.1 DNA-binding response regulator [Amycolatopsis keratiniphila subsp. nogabecina]ONF67512.1 DNA-binding response regulator [Amycolatopsis keratiniphila subsp. keratiniphila]RSN20388.1 DNA-binding response regulator [Amycolatopsis sp. WAC 04169]UMP07593.1 response regulator transcription factor [Amycolatopsis sp. EV170708-02-1]
MIKVLVAEDMHIVRGALVALLGLEPDIEVVAECASGDEILPLAQSARPDIALIDIDLPGKDGLTAAAELHEQLPGVRTLILTSLGSPGTLRRALAAKVNGFLRKDAPADRLANAVRGVAAGRRVVDGDLALAAWDSEECPLTAREIEVLRLASVGSDPTEIAAELFLSAGTVRNYLTTIVSKLSARNRVDAVRIARESGWL